MALALLTRLSLAEGSYGLPKIFGSLAVMSNQPEPDLGRFGRIVRERREELGLQQEDVRDHHGPSSTTMSGIERGAITPSPLTLRKLDTALQWVAGSAQIALGGGDPTPVTDLNTAERAERFIEMVSAGDVSPSRDDVKQVSRFLATRGRRAVLDSAMSKAADAAVLMGKSLVAMLEATAALQLAEADRRRIERIRADIDLLDRSVVPAIQVPEVMETYSAEVHRAVVEVQQILMRATAFNHGEVVDSAVSEASKTFNTRSEQTTQILTDAIERVRRIDEQVAQLESEENALETATESPASSEGDEIEEDAPGNRPGVVKPIRPRQPHWGGGTNPPLPPSLEEADAASRGYKQADDEPNDDDDLSDNADPSETP